MSGTKRRSCQTCSGTSLLQDNVRQIQKGVEEEDGVHESPIDINIAKTIQIQLPPLEWHNYSLPPKKMKITNTGYTLILSAKWHQERPYISGGPLEGNYVFSQLHFHWGKNDGEGSEHSMDGCKFPMEMHLVAFKANYLTQESALKEKDGIIVLAFIFKLQSGKNPSLQYLVDGMRSIQQPHTSVKLDPVALNYFVRKFDSDYFIYWGSVMTTVCSHYILWMVSREPAGVSTEQVEMFRTLIDATAQPLEGNFRNIQPLNQRKIYHANPSSASKKTTLLPFY